MAFKWFKKKKESDTEELPSEEHEQLEEAHEPDKNQSEAASDEIPPAPEESQPTVEAAPEPIPEPQGPSDGDRLLDEKANVAAKAEAEEPPKPKKKSLFKRLRSGLAKTRKILTSDIDDLFAEKAELDDDMLENLEELLITADIGVQTAMEIIEKIQKQAGDIHNSKDLIAALKKELEALFETVRPAAQSPVPPPRIIMVIGVNGVGKTTTIGKLAAKHTAQGEKVLIAAADTFRAAAVEQLTIWAERANAMIVKHKDNADPAAVAYDAVNAATSRGVDTVFIDTAGRLHTKVNLMEELKKIKRSVDKALPGAPHEILLVLDATTGQNAISQAKLFNDALDVTGLVLTKLDGTAKGGVTIAICSQYDIPLTHIGVGESIDDLQVFDPKQFVEALF